MTWPSTWTDRLGRDRTPTIPGHELAGAVGALVAQLAREAGAYGGDIGTRSARLIRSGGILVSIVGPSETRPADGLAIDFVVESDRAQLSEIVQRVRDGRLRTNIGVVATLDGAVATFNSTKRHAGKTIVRVRP